MKAKLRTAIGVCLVVFLFAAFSLAVGSMADWIMQLLLPNNSISTRSVTGSIVGTALFFAVAIMKMNDFMAFTGFIADRFDIERAHAPAFDTFGGEQWPSFIRLAHTFAFIALVLGLIATIFLSNERPLPIIGYLLLPGVFVLTTYIVFLLLAVLLAGTVALDRDIHNRRKK